MLPQNSLRNQELASIQHSSGMVAALLCVLVVGIAAFLPAHAVEPAPGCEPISATVDTSNWDIAGVKLGMSRDEAVAALAKYFGISTNQVRGSGEEKGGRFFVRYADVKSMRSVSVESTTLFYEIQMIIIPKENLPVELAIAQTARQAATLVGKMEMKAVAEARIKEVEEAMVVHKELDFRTQTAALDEYVLAKYGCPTTSVAARSQTGDMFGWEWCPQLDKQYGKTCPKPYNENPAARPLVYNHPTRDSEKYPVLTLKAYKK
ncbi:MAG: hypothetical protein LBQ75_01100 [Zoogloeaceae bacterium]|nr:hypothetical protein [Zoogloeaceae bacterium]